MKKIRDTVVNLTNAAVDSWARIRRHAVRRRVWKSRRHYSVVA